MSFWASFLVDETFACDPQLDCFLREPSTFLVFSSKRLDNCTSYNGTNSTVVCFTFSFNFNNGFSSAVGFIGVAVVYCRLCVSLLIYSWELPQKKNHNREQKCNCSCFCSWFLVLFTITVLISFAIVTSIVIIKADRLKTNESILLNISYCLCYLYVGPLLLFLVTFCILRKGKKILPTSHTELPSILESAEELMERAPLNYPNIAYVRRK